MKVLITGGAGFIGCNLAESFLKQGNKVIVFDNLSRPCVVNNVKFLTAKYKKGLTIEKADVRDKRAVYGSMSGVDAVFHLASQVAVTTSIKDPEYDFEVNAKGTLNLLEAVRTKSKNAPFIYSSTNKVYGDLADVQVIKTKTKYGYKNIAGITEDHPIDFHSPYGCSKGAADQYVRDYSRIYGMNTVVLRQSCIYGYHQYGMEDQGWVAWFTMACVKGNPIDIYGDGKQVRDILFSSDLCDLYLELLRNIERVRGKIYNVGGGPSNAISLLELISVLEKLSSSKIKLRFHDWRAGDQKVFISDITKLKRDILWEPKINALHGIKKLYDWVLKNKQLL